MVLAVPASSTPSEKILARAESVIHAERTILFPENVGKNQTIYDKCSLSKKM
jgi:hypothetical protein